jgi:hypothetical protein
MKKQIGLKPLTKEQSFERQIKKTNKLVEISLAYKFKNINL